MSFNKISLADRTPIVTECLTAKLEVTKDPNNKEKLITTKVPCVRIEDVSGTQLCTTYLYPGKKWKTHACPFAQVALTTEQEHKINPLKASKRAAAGKK
jgi:hypothetical protein